MALQKANGEYIIVTDCDNSSVRITRYQNKAQRERDKNGTLTQFEQVMNDSIAVNVDLDATADAEKTIKNNNVTAGYVALKTLDEFNDCTDV